VVTHGLNLLRHGAETARKNAGFTQSEVLAETAGRSIKRMVQLRKRRPGGNSWESLVEGQTPLSGDTRRSSSFWEKAGAVRDAKGVCT
jgi:hypothetical protein